VSFACVEFKAGSASTAVSCARAVLQGDGASAIHVLCMDKLTENAIREIEQIHSSWIEFEVGRKS